METHKAYKNGDRLLCFPCYIGNYAFAGMWITL
jgi:hypothetical protein